MCRRTFEEHLQNLETVLKKLESKGIKFNFQVVIFLNEKRNILDESFLKVTRLTPTMQTVGKISSFLAFLGHDRGFVKKSFKYCKSLYEFLKVENNISGLKLIKEKRKLQRSQLY